MNEYRCTAIEIYNRRDGEYKHNYYILAESIDEAYNTMEKIFPDRPIGIERVSENKLDIENIEPETIPHNLKCEYHGQNIETEVLDTLVYPKPKIIELRCIDVCKQCGEGYGKIYTLFADKYVKEV